MRKWWKQNERGERTILNPHSRIIESHDSQQKQKKQTIPSEKETSECFVLGP
jgi:hypothetical protein